MVRPKAPDLHGRRVCGNCYHFERFPDNRQPRGNDIAGECMLIPPEVHGYTELDEPIQSRPLVYFHERCGSYQAQEH
jgi:hypothetical protein